MATNFQYIGNSAYCYANCTSMLLSSIGENFSPSHIEVLTGVGLSASIEKAGFLFLNNQCLEPDLGIVSVLKILGFEVDVSFKDNPDDYPFEELKEAIEKAPVIIGPVDMGYLTYNPNHPYMHGGDHFIFAFKSDGDRIYLHDPAGFPHSFIKKDDLKEAWRADKVFYRQGYYRYIINIRRISSPTIEQVYQGALERFKKIYRDGEANTDQSIWKIGSQAILNTVERLKNNHVSQNELNNFVYFTFQLGARRAQDYALFFKENNPELSVLKFEQSQILGETHTATVNKDWDLVCESLKKLADNEDRFKEILLST